MSLLKVAKEVSLDHDNVRELFDRYKSASEVALKAKIANTLIREMAIHGEAEEISVYNKLAEYGMFDEVEHDKAEHRQVKELVAKADQMDPTHGDFDKIITEAVTVFIKHAEEEEDGQLKKFEAKLSPEENDKIAREFLAARKKVPTRPHPTAPQTGGIAQKAAGMAAQLMDVAADSMGGREFVELKYSHPQV
ncbi:hypothetical protein K474DRAFT_830981 [Panus rudis PR-1116 ss-1]|nr:hypothetical protein K474DRAFT_830981 [Panus rudis PR-1116 ss-1]